MARGRAVLGLIAGGMLILSSAAHSLLGWPALSAQLAAAPVPADLLLGVQIGWQFAGVAMLAFGIVVVALFAKRLRGENASTGPAAVVAATYLAFGCWALVASRFEPFFLVFIVPGVLLALAVSSPAPARS
jgi:hypothetical protein